MNYGADVVAWVIDELGIDIVSEHGDWGAARCPLHDDKSPSFTINLQEGGWRCYSGCGSNGDLAALVVEANGGELADVRRRLRRRMPHDESALMKALDAAEQEIAKEAGPKGPLDYEHGVAPKYLLDRGFTLETLKAWDIGWDPERNSVVLPATENGDLIGLVRRKLNGQPKYKNSDGFLPSERGHLFGLDHVPADTRWVIVCEGPLDAIWLWQCGLPAVALLGASLSTRQADSLRRRFWRVVIATDSDKTGRRAAVEIRKALSDLSVQRFPIERGKKDVQESSCEYLHSALESIALIEI